MIWTDEQARSACRKYAKSAWREPVDYTHILKAIGRALLTLEARVKELEQERDTWTEQRDRLISAVDEASQIEAQRDELARDLAITRDTLFAAQQAVIREGMERDAARRERDALREALADVYNCLGPKANACVECQGCAVEIDFALDTVRGALGIEKGVYPAPEAALRPTAAPEPAPGETM